MWLFPNNYILWAIISVISLYAKIITSALVTYANEVAKLDRKGIKGDKTRNIPDSITRIKHYFFKVIMS